MRRHRAFPTGPALAAAATILATPVPAQDGLTAELVLDTFIARCTSVLADPEAAVAAAFRSEIASGAITGDGTLLRYQEQLTLAPETFAFVYAVRTQLPGGTESYCGMSVSFLATDGPLLALTELPDLMEAAAERVLGAPAKRLGSEVTQREGFGRMFVWTTGDSPDDPIMSLLQDPQVIQLGLELSAPSN